MGWTRRMRVGKSIEKCLLKDLNLNRTVVMDLEETFCGLD
jgi:hypothetical protein